MQNQTDEKSIEERLREFYAGEGFTDEEINELADTERSIQALEQDQTIPEEERKQGIKNEIEKIVSDWKNKIYELNFKGIESFKFFIKQDNLVIRRQ